MHEAGTRHETLFGDAAEADAFVYSLYADVVAGRVTEDTLFEVCERGRVYPDVLATTLRYARMIERGEVVERILIHLERQSPPSAFQVYGSRAVPFYNYLQAAFVVYEDGRLTPEGVMRVGVELVVQHRFDGDALARSYLDLARRGHLRGIKAVELAASLDALEKSGKLPAARELRASSPSASRRWGRWRAGTTRRRLARATTRRWSWPTTRGGRSAEARPGRALRHTHALLSSSPTPPAPGTMYWCSSSPRSSSQRVPGTVARTSAALKPRSRRQA